MIFDRFIISDKLNYCSTKNKSLRKGEKKPEKTILRTNKLKICEKSEFFNVIVKIFSTFIYDTI